MTQTSGLEAKMIATKMPTTNYGEKAMQDRWFVVHTQSGRALTPSISFGTQAEAEARIGRICAAIPEADWTKPVAQLAGIANLQIRVIKAQ